MFERMLIEHCAPTLASLKTASLFSYSGEDRENINHIIKEWNDQLNPRGVYLTVLHDCPKRVLIYVYRPDKLKADLNRTQVLDFMQKHGYNKTEKMPITECGDTETDDLTGYLDQLKGKFACGDGFPHEIGLFLGYPLEDVEGFIKFGGKNALCCGCWKVYGDEKKARQSFARYKKCTNVYIKLFFMGRSVRQLTVAA